MTAHPSTHPSPDVATPRVESPKPRRPTPLSSHSSRKPASDAEPTTQPDVGLSHIALTVRNVDTSAAFYARFASFEVVHRRGRVGHRVVWLSDLRRPFVVVLVESEQSGARLDGIAHLGIGCESRGEVDALAKRARLDGCLERPPTDGGAPVGYWALLRDPDGHNLELSHGQHVGHSVDVCREASAAR